MQPDSGRDPDVKALGLVGAATRTADGGLRRSVGRKYNEKPMKRFNAFIMMVAALVVAAAMVWWAFS